MHQYIAVGTKRMFIEPSAIRLTLQTRLHLLHTDCSLLALSLSLYFDDMSTCVLLFLLFVLVVCGFFPLYRNVISYVMRESA